MATRAGFMQLVRLGFIEWWRTRGPWLAVGAIALSVGLAFFGGSLALTESLAVTRTLYAASVRLLLVLGLGLLVIGNAARDRDDGLLEMMLSRPMPVWHWILAKFTAHAGAALLCAAAACVPLMGGAPLGFMSFGISLAAELMVTGAAALALGLGVRQPTPAVLAFAGFYLLARAAGDLARIAAADLLATGTAAQDLAARLMNLVALLLPDLARYTRAEWVTGLHLPTEADWEFLAMTTGLWVPILLLIAVIDLDGSRR